MEAEPLPNYLEAEEGEILHDDPDELYTPLERPHISSTNACAAKDTHSSDDDNQGKDSSSDSDSSYKNFRPPKIRKKSMFQAKVSNPKKKNYSIWCSDVQAEVLTSSLVDCNFDQSNDRDRDVESYNYKLGLSDQSNKFKNNSTSTKDSGGKQAFGKRKHNGVYIEKKVVKDVEKEKKLDQSMVRNILRLSSSVESSEEELATDIANKLCEEKEDLILRATKILGKEIVISLFEDTRNIEATGGMLTMNGCRRRTPGGVFFYLLKTSEDIPREKINLVLSEDKKSRAEEKKLAAKKMRQLKAEKLKETLSKDDFPTLLSRTELAIKEFKAKKLAEDSAEFKNPPPSPATDVRDCISDGEERFGLEKDIIGLAQCVQSLIVYWLCLVLVLTADDHESDDDADKFNFTLKDILVPDKSKSDYLNFDFNAFWSHNESYYLSKLDDFDVFSFQDIHGNDFDTTTEKHPWKNSNAQNPGMSSHDPIFDNNLVTNVTVQLGETAFLRCRVRNLGERPVSWVRRRDWHILTSGMFTYTNDERFQVAHTEGGDDWNLQIKYVQKRDNGTYECQVATGKGTISHYYNLHVVVPSAFILGSGEYHIGEGSTISLVCIIENSPSPPQYVFWYHNERMINYDTTRGGVTVSTEPGPKTHSRLIINSATTSDSGNYTCRASNTEADTIYVFVSKGDNTAAIQRQESKSTNCKSTPVYFLIFLITVSVVR